ncbi:hypothetical protein ES705_45284 [subsurface metagenome]
MLVKLLEIGRQLELRDLRVLLKLAEVLIAIAEEKDENVVAD